MTKPHKTFKKWAWLGSYIKNLRHTTTSAYRQKKTALSFIYGKCTSLQGKVCTVVVDKIYTYLVCTNSANMYPFMQTSFHFLILQ